MKKRWGFVMFAGAWLLVSAASCKRKGLDETPLPMTCGECRITGYTGALPTGQDCLYQGAIWHCETDYVGTSKLIYCTERSSNGRIAEVSP